MPAPFDALALGLPGNPLELISLLLVVDAIAMAVLAGLDALHKRHQHQAR